MSKGSEAVARHRASKMVEGWVRIDGLLPPESAQEARRMIEEGLATSLIHAAAVALSERSEAKRQIDILEAELATAEYEKHISG